MNDSESLRFSGTINASLTHEIRNVLAVIRETGGLLQDILALDTPDTPRHQRFLRGLESINDQVLRGSQILDRMGRFAHSTDHPVEHFDLRDASLDFFSLSERFFKLAQITLVPEPIESPIPVTASSFLFFAALYRAMEPCLNLPEGTQIRVSFSKTGSLCFHVADLFTSFTEQELSGGFRIEGDGQGIYVRITK